MDTESLQEDLLGGDRLAGRGNTAGLGGGDGTEGTVVVLASDMGGEDGAGGAMVDTRGDLAGLYRVNGAGMVAGLSWEEGDFRDDMAVFSRGELSGRYITDVIRGEATGRRDLTECM
jgi:hypothetical protein